MFLVSDLSYFSVVICVFGSLPNFPKHHLKVVFKDVDILDV